MTEHRWKCPDCGTVNDLRPAVVELCSETWQHCSDCDERFKFNLSGEWA